MKTSAAVILAVLISATQLWAGGIGDSVEVRIISDSGREIPFYPVLASNSDKKVYAEAVKGDHYRIFVRNKLNRRIGVVIAVDGRNIISGRKSWLKNDERMYILAPYAGHEYAGWRTGRDRINRFYFTETPDSYAAAFGDRTAMGVIAVAVYPEVRRYEPPAQLRGQESVPAPSAPSGTGGPECRKSAERLDRSAGTGYGRTEYSPAYTVVFDPEPRAVERFYIKYEWRRTLCRLGIIGSAPRHPQPHNRLWDNAGFAPPPPGRE